MKRSVLIVEENISIQYLLSTVLKKECRIIAHTDCYSAVRDLKREDIKLAIINIDDISSKNYEFLIHLHFSGFYSSIPVIVISGNNTDEFRLACSALGIEAFFLKPFDPLSLLEVVKDILYLSEADFIQVKIDKGSS